MGDDIEREVLNMVYTLGAQQLKQVCEYLNVNTSEGNNTTPTLRRKVIRKLSETDIEGAKMGMK